jgi:hypothetical protein
MPARTPAVNGAAPGSAKPNVPSHADVAVLPVKTDDGGDVVGVGQPRMQLADASEVGELALG